MKRCIAVILVTTTLAALVIYLTEERRISRLQTENQNLAADQTPTDPQQPAATALTKAERDELEQLRKNTPELLRLRGEVTLLRKERDAQRQQLASSASGPVRSRPAGGFISKEQLVSAGTATPEAALQTFVAAITSRNFDQLLAVMPLEDTRDSASIRASFEKARQQADLPRLEGMQITATAVYGVRP